MKPNILCLILVFFASALFAEDLSFQLRPSCPGVAICFSNKTNQNIVIPALVEGGFFRFCIITSAGLSMSRVSPAPERKIYIPPKGAIIIAANAEDWLHFDDPDLSIPKEKLPAFVYIFFKAIINNKLRFSFIGPIIASISSGSENISYSFYSEKISSDVQRHVTEEFNNFQTRFNP